MAEPQIIVEPDGRGAWHAVGPRARDADWGRTKRALMETLAAGKRSPDMVVEVRGDREPYRTTIAQIRADYGKEYRGQPSVDMNPQNDPDPFYDFF
mgnify:CR=1 FL=1